MPFITVAVIIHHCSFKNRMAERHWVEINSRINCPIKTHLNIMVQDELIDMTNKIDQFCVSTVVIQVVQAGVRELLQLVQLVLILSSLLATLRGVNTAFFFSTNMPRLTNNSLAGLGLNSDVPLPVSTTNDGIPKDPYSLKYVTVDDAIRSFVDLGPGL